MTLKEKIETNYKNSLKSKDKMKISTYRLILSSIKDLDIVNRSGPNKKETDDKDAQIAALQKQIDEFKEQIEALKNQPDNEKTSFLKEYLPNAGESLGKATGPAFLISLTFGLSYLIGTPPNDIAELLKLLK